VALTEQERNAVARACPRSLTGWGGTTPQADLLALVAEAERGGEPDRYGAGGLVAEVEEQVRALLEAPAAVLCPSGTLAQQAALRHWCARTPRVGLHASAHPVLHEDDALPVVQGLVPVVVGERPDLAAVQAAHAQAPLGALLVELPQRETGGDLMGFDELAALSAWCREEGVRLHLDGARLWECGPAYAPHALADVVALADSTYVSLYKGLGALAGAVLLGPVDLVEQTRTWRHRLGGTLPVLWPMALGARAGLRDRLPEVPRWVEHAQALARALGEVGVEVVVPPVTPLLHVVLPGEPDAVQEVLIERSRATGVWLGRAQAGPRPGTSRVEVSVAGRSLQVPPEEGAALVRQVVDRLTGTAVGSSAEAVGTAAHGGAA